MKPNGDRFRNHGVVPGEVYEAPSFDPQDTVNSTFEYYSTFMCAKKMGAQFRFRISNNPPKYSAKPPVITPPIDDPNPKYPRAIPVTDGRAMLN